MLVDVIGGSDKTIASVATGQQEYHPFYASPGNISNEARRGHGIGVLPVAFLPIPRGTYIEIISLSLNYVSTSPSKQVAARQTCLQAL